MKLELLEPLSDEQLGAVITRATEMLSARDRQRKEKALDDARALLASVGLSLKDLAGKRMAKPAASGFKPKSGHLYQHPDNPAQQCPGTGNKPKWWHELAKVGREPIDLGPAKKVAA